MASKSMFKIFLLFVFLSHQAYAGDIIFFKGDAGARTTPGDAVKVKDGENPPDSIAPGQHVGIYLGEQKKNLLLELRIATTCKPTAKDSFQITYNGKRLANESLGRPFKVVRIPIPLTAHEAEENILDLFNSSMNPVGLRFLRISEYDFKSLQPIYLCLENPERYPSSIRKYFDYKISSSAAEKGTPDIKDPSKVTDDLPAELKEKILSSKDIVNFCASEQEKLFSEILQKEPEKDNSLNTCILMYRFADTEDAQKKDAFSFLSVLLDAPKHSLTAMMLKDLWHNGETFLVDRDFKLKPPTFLLPFLCNLYAKGSRMLPCAVKTASDEPLPDDVHYLASSTDDGSATCIVFSRSGREMKISMLLPWNGKAVMEKYDGAMPDAKTKMPEKQAVEIPKSGEDAGLFDIALPQGVFHYIRVAKEGTKETVRNGDKLPEPIVPKDKVINLQTVLGILNQMPPPILNHARLAKGECAAFGPLKEKIQSEVKAATSATLDNIKNVVPDEKESVFISFAKLLDTGKDKSGVGLSVKSWSLPEPLAGLGFWLYVHSSTPKSVFLTFEHGSLVCNLSIKPEKWEYVIIPLAKLESSNIRLLYPRTDSDIKIELNGFDWISSRNLEKEENGIRKFEAKVNEKEQKVDIQLEGVPGGYCEIRRRLGLNFVPDSIKISNMSVKDDSAPDLKTTYHKASGIIDITGRFPKSDGLKTVKCQILLEVKEKEK